MKQGLTFLVVLVVAVAAGWYSLDPRFPVQKGLDLQGGMRVTLEADTTKVEGKVDAEKMASVRDVLESRVNSFGLSGSTVRLKSSGGKQQILIELPGVKNPEEALNTISKVAQLEFRHLSNVEGDRNPGARYKMSVKRGDATKGEADTYSFTDSATGKPVPEADVLKDAPLILKGDYLKPNSHAEINPQTAQPYVAFEFNNEGRRIFGDFTTANVNERLAVVLDGHVITAPNINEPITEGTGTISGGFSTMAEARTLANLLRSGSLPVPLKAAETQQVGATLGQDSVNKSVQAGMVGLGLVLVFMLAYYWLPGALACIALLIYAALTFALFKGIPGFTPPIVMDLPGITGFILSVGMAVDANVLIFERLKEELRSGKGLHAAIDAGFSRAFSSILDSNVTTWIVCSILIWLGAPIIKGFAINLALGVAVSMFTAITVTRTMLHLVVQMPWARDARLYALNVSWLYMAFPKAKEGGILDVYAKRRINFGFSIGLGVVALVFILLTFVGKGLKPGIDFTGGSALEVPYRNNTVTRDEVAKVLSDAGIKDAIVTIAKSETPWTKVTVEATGVDPLQETKIRERLANTNILNGFDPASYQTGDGKKADEKKPDDKKADDKKPGAKSPEPPSPEPKKQGLGTVRSFWGQTYAQNKPAAPAATKPADAPAAKPAAKPEAKPAETGAKPGATASTPSGTVNVVPAGDAPAANAPKGNAPAANAPAGNKPAAGNAPAGNAPAAAPAAPKGPPFKASAHYMAAVTEEQVRKALNTKISSDDVPLNLNGLKITIAEETHKGDAAISVADIQSRQLTPDVLRELKKKLAGIGGGIIEPMYEASSIGPSVAAEITGNAFGSVLVASLAIVLYLAFRFAIGGFINGLKFGVSAIIALIHDVGIVIGLFALMGELLGWQVDSLFVTAALTILGFSVHDTIVVYDRIRENLHHRGKGETLPHVSDRSITQTFDRSINTSLTVLLVVAALVFFGGETVRLFNVALLIGIAIGTYSSIFVASPLVVMMEKLGGSGAPVPVAAPGRVSGRSGDVSLVNRPGPRPSTASPVAARAVTSAGPVAGAGAGEPGDEGRPKSGAIKPKKGRRQ